MHRLHILVSACGAPEINCVLTCTYSRSFYNYAARATRNGRSKPEEEFFVGSQTEDNHYNMYELSRLIRQRGSVGSLEPGDSVTPSSLSEILSDAPESEQAMA